MTVIRLVRAWQPRMAVGALLLLCAVTARADPEVFVTVTCDVERGELRIDERHDDREISYPIVIGEKDMEFAVTGLVSTKDVAGEIAWEDRPISRECRLEANVYVATFRALSSSNNAQGHCGADPPTASITLSRNGKPILKDLVLDEGCEADQLITGLRILDKAQVVVAAVSRKTVDADGAVRSARIPMGDTITSETIYSAATARAAP